MSPRGCADEDSFRVATRPRPRRSASLDVALNGGRRAKTHHARADRISPNDAPRGSPCSCPRWSSPSRSCSSSCWVTTSGSSSTSGTSSPSAADRRRRPVRAAQRALDDLPVLVYRGLYRVFRLGTYVPYQSMSIMSTSRSPCSSASSCGAAGSAMARHRRRVALRAVRRREPGHRLGVPDGVECGVRVRTRPTAARRSRRTGGPPRLARPRRRSPRAAVLGSGSHDGRRRRDRRARPARMAHRVAAHCSARVHLHHLVARLRPGRVQVRAPRGGSAARVVLTGIGATFGALGQFPVVGLALGRLLVVGRVRLARSRWPELRTGRRHRWASCSVRSCSS